MTKKKTPVKKKKQLKAAIKLSSGEAGMKRVFGALNRVGIDVDDVLPVSGQDQITLSLDYKRLRLEICAEEDEYHKIQVVATSAKHRQAILALIEPERTMNHYDVAVQAHTFAGAKKAADISQGTLRKLFFTSMPDKTSYSFRLKSGKSRNGVPQPGSTITLTAKAEASKQVFLIGYDEQHMFISELPADAKDVTSVRAAHRALRPKGLPSTAVRQGEFFFVPVPKSQLTRKFYESLPPASSSDGGILDAAGNETDHIPSVYMESNLSRAAYVIGNVVAPRHKTLTFHTLHRVVVNREVPNSHNEYD